MITAHQARELMPNIGDTMKSIENHVTLHAERGETNCLYTFRKKNVAVRRMVRSLLIKLGYSISDQSQNSIKISWKKL